jgi:predicted negative regulator of RcsB-dependent stress response
VSEYLDEEEQLARVKSWWDENGTSTIITIVVAVAAIVGWRWWDDRTETLMHEASDAYLAYLEGEDDAINRITSEHEGTAYHVLVLLDQAKDAVEEGDLVQAEALLENAIAQDGGPLLGDVARIRLARVQQGLDRSEAALETLTQIKSEGYRAYALEVQGDIYSARGEIEQAYNSYQAAVDALREGEERNILTMKLNNAAPYAGEFVQPQDSLSEALEAAQQTLEAAVETTTEQAEAAEATGTPVQADEPAADIAPLESSEDSDGDSDGG